LPASNESIGCFSEDEIHPELRFTGAGILAMANAGPNTNGLPLIPFSLRDPVTQRHPGSQFFMTLAPTPFLDNKHTIFGRVSSGMRVLQRLGAVAVDAQDRSVQHFSTYAKKSLIDVARPNRPREEVKIHKAQTGT